jgi:hypothetical protein
MKCPESGAKNTITPEGLGNHIPPYLSEAGELVSNYLKLTKRE